MVGPLKAFQYRRAKKKEPQPGLFTCAHQERGQFPCAVPSCPASPAGDFLRLKVKRSNGLVFKARFKRTRVTEGDSVRFTWRPG